MEKKPVHDALIDILTENKSLINDSTSLMKTLEARTSAEHWRDLALFRKALLDVNVGEILAVADIASQENRDKAEIEILARLNNIMQQKLAKSVAKTLIDAVLLADEQERERQERERQKQQERERQERERQERERQERERQEQEKEEAERLQREQEEKKREEQKRQFLAAQEKERKAREELEREKQKLEEKRKRKDKNTSSWAEVLGCLIPLAILMGALTIYNDMYPSQPHSQETKKANSNVTPQIDLNEFVKQQPSKQSSETSLDGIEIGMKTTDMITLKGGAKSQSEWILPGYTLYDYGNLNAVVKGDKVCYIYTNNPTLASNKNIHPGSSADELKKAYGSTKTSYFSNQLYEFSSIDNQKCYVGFEVSNGAVTGIRIAIKDVYDFWGAYKGLTTFHALITKKDYDSAFDAFLTEKMRNRIENFDRWKAGYRTTVKSEIKKVNSVKKVGSQVEIAYDLEATDNPGGTRYFTGRALISNNGTFWAIDYMENR